MKSQALIEHDPIGYVQKLIDARSHWIIVVGSPLSLDLLEGIRELFYEDDGLTLILMPFNKHVIALGVGDKRNMSPSQLAEACHIPEPEFSDILMAPDTSLEVVDWLERTFKSEGLN